MKQILIASTHYFPDRPNGAARIACDLAHGLAAAGHDVWYLCQDLTGLGQTYELDRQVKVLRYSLKRGTLPASLLHTGSIKRVLDAHLPGPPDIIHGHAPLEYLACVSAFSGVPKTYYTVHSPAIEELAISWRSAGALGHLKALLGLPLIRRMEHRILQNSDGISALSQYTCTLLKQHYGSAVPQIKVIQGWADISRFPPLTEPVEAVRGRLGWPISSPVLFALRRLETRMGLDNLLHALKIVRDRGHNFHMAIGGAGSQASALLNLRDSLQLQSYVSFMGRLSDEDVTLAYGACNATVVPTAQLEGFGLIVLESLAAGRPALVTPVGALPEIVRQFESSWIASSATPVGIADLICSYLDGELPYDDEKVKTKLQHYTFSRALAEYEEWLML